MELKKLQSLLIIVFVCLLYIAPVQSHAQSSKQAGSHAGHNHAGHDHSGHAHSGHNHGHDHSGHSHADHKHSGHNHGGKADRGTKGDKGTKGDRGDRGTKGDHGDHGDHGTHGDHGAHGDHGDHLEDQEMDVGGTIMHHIADSHDIHLPFGYSIPLPCILYSPEAGFNMFMSSAFDHGHKEVNGYAYHHGKVTRADGAKFYDFSITRNVFVMFLSGLLMCWIFIGAARAYGKNKGAPRGIQSIVEPIYEFVRDDIAKPSIGPKYKKYMPFLLTVFFFIWINNLLGLIPIPPFGANVTGNIAVTAALALITFVLIVTGANKDYWMHIFNPPGVPLGVKPILILIEFLSLFIKPAALMIRLFANITAGHIIILSLVSLIFIAGHLANAAVGFGSSLLVVPFMLFMNCLELFVAALQAFVFTILSAVFIGQAVEEHDHHEAH